MTGRPVAANITAFDISPYESNALNTGKKPVIATVAVDTYEENAVNSALERLFDLLGSPSLFFKAGQTVALKPNLLMAAAPEQAITAHPTVISAAADICLSQGAKVKIVDSPGSGTPWNESSLRKLYAKCGIESLAQQNVELNFNTAVRKAPCPEGKLVRSFELIEAALDVDVLISISKAKTHSFTIMTNAVKNLFGLVPGFDKPGFHARMKNPENFSEMLVDLAGLAKPALTIVDAIIGMEGDGPTSGSPRKFGFLLASTNLHALDVAVAHVMNIDPLRVPTIAAAKKRGLTTGIFTDIEILGDKDALTPIEDFVPPRTIGGTGLGMAGFLVSLLSPVLKRMFVLKPVPVKSLCVGCGACQDACPNLAVTVESGKAKIKRDQCILCYCCNEVCPHDAMKLKGSILYKLFHKVYR